MEDTLTYSPDLIVFWFMVFLGPLLLLLAILSILEVFGVGRQKKIAAKNLFRKKRSQENTPGRISRDAIEQRSES